MSELENARLVRLLCKFGFINERPEYVLVSMQIFHRDNILYPDSPGSHGGLKLGTDISSSSFVTLSSTKLTRQGILSSVSLMF